MASVKKGQLTATPEWAKHLRKFGKRLFWRGERRAEKKTAYEQLKDKARHD